VKCKNSFFRQKNRRLLKAPDGITFAHQQRTMMGNASSSSSSSVVFSQTIAEGQARRKWWWWFLAFARFFTQKRNFDFDHQVTPYVSTIAPHEVFPSVALIFKGSHPGVLNKGAQISAQPFFSPENSERVALEMIEDAEETLDIFTPGVKFWSYERRRGDATTTENSTKNNNNNNNNCGGVLPSRAMAKESFPVFFALLNAAKRNVTVRVLTNKYDDEEVGCDGRVTMKDFLSLANPEKMEVRYYRSTSFMHAKYIARDGGKAMSISSVNWSRESMRENREAGIILREGDGPDRLFDRVSNRAFEYDWKRAQKHARGVEDIAKEEMAIIKGSAVGDAKLAKTKGMANKNAKNTITNDDSVKPFVTKMEKIPLGEGSSVEMFVSPDFSRDSLLRFLRSAENVVYIYTYQITDDEIADTLVDLAMRNDVKVFLMLSPRIYADWDRKKASQVQTRLSQVGGKNIIIHSAPKHFRYSHLKFIVKDRKSTFETLLMTGNLSPSDLPEGNIFKPCHGMSSCSRANRDINVIFREKDGAIASKFLEVFEGDLKMATEYSNPTKY
jgi:phosphatidylserine/phosphatidylglycerophosphate/cardiolipin synthase-like enzyme